MARLAAGMAIIALALTTSSVKANDLYRIRHHDYWNHDLHRPNVAVLDQLTDRLAIVARHLDEDACKLSQDYRNSHRVKHYVTRLARLQHHMHDLLHDASRRCHQSQALVNHLKGDVRESKVLLERLDRELEYQGFDGVRPCDARLLVHMREVILREAFPLITRLENELYGYRSYTSARPYIHHPSPRPQPVVIPSSRSDLGNFQMRIPIGGRWSFTIR